MGYLRGVSWAYIEYLGPETFPKPRPSRRKNTHRCGIDNSIPRWYVLLAMSWQWMESEKGGRFKPPPWGGNHETFNLYRVSGNIRKNTILKSLKSTKLKTLASSKILCTQKNKNLNNIKRQHFVANLCISKTNDKDGKGSKSRTSSGNEP